LDMAAEMKKGCDIVWSGWRVCSIRRKLLPPHVTSRLHFKIKDSSALKKETASFSKVFVLVYQTKHSKSQKTEMFIVTALLTSNFSFVNDYVTLQNLMQGTA
jgi:hypothetical protein